MVVQTVIPATQEAEIRKITRPAEGTKLLESISINKPGVVVHTCDPR
jgi:hypothetical protein